MANLDAPKRQHIPGREMAKLEIPLRLENDNFLNIFYYLKKLKKKT